MRSVEEIKAEILQGFNIVDPSLHQAFSQILEGKIRDRIHVARDEGKMIDRLKKAMGKFTQAWNPKTWLETAGYYKEKYALDSAE